MTTDSLLLTLDLGTGSCRALLFDQAGRELAIAQREWSHDSLPDVPGSQVFDTARNWELLTSCIQEVVASIDSSRIRAVCATSMREGMVLLDSEGQEIWACPNVDGRATAQAEWLIREGLADEIYAIAGDWVSITAPARFRWLREQQPDLLEQAHDVLLLSDWVAYRLCGERATDPSIGSSSGMFELAARTWSDKIIAICGLPASIFPPVREAGTVLGEVLPLVADRTGLAPGTKVVVGGADTQFALVGIGAISPGSTAVIGGSFWQCAQVCDEPIIDPSISLRTLCHSVQGQWMIEGIGFWSGLALRWFRDGFCRPEVDQAREQGIDAYALLEAAAEDVPPGSRGVLAILSNVMSARSWDHAAPSLVQYNIPAPEASGKAESFRAIQEAAVYVVREHERMLRSLTGVSPDDILFAGGAARGELWPQILADVTGASVSVPTVSESSALGAAMYAGIGGGIWTDLTAALEIAAPVSRRFEPDPSRHDQYQALADHWKNVYDHMLELTHEAGLEPMWRAPNA